MSRMMMPLVPTMAGSAYNNEQGFANVTPPTMPQPANTPGLRLVRSAPMVGSDVAAALSGQNPRGHSRYDMVPLPPPSVTSGAYSSPAPSAGMPQPIPGVTMPTDPLTRARLGLDDPRVARRTEEQLGLRAPAPAQNYPHLPEYDWVHTVYMPPSTMMPSRKPTPAATQPATQPAVNPHPGMVPTRITSGPNGETITYGPAPLPSGLTPSQQAILDQRKNEMLWRQTKDVAAGAYTVGKDIVQGIGGALGFGNKGSSTASNKAGWPADWSDAEEKMLQNDIRSVRSYNHDESLKAMNDINYVPKYKTEPTRDERIKAKKPQTGGSSSGGSTSKTETPAGELAPSMGETARGVAANTMAFGNGPVTTTGTFPPAPNTTPAAATSSGQQYFNQQMAKVKEWQSPNTPQQIFEISKPPYPGAHLSDPAIAKQFIIAAKGDVQLGMQMARDAKWQVDDLPQ